MKQALIELKQQIEEELNKSLQSHIKIFDPDGFKKFEEMQQSNSGVLCAKNSGIFVGSDALPIRGNDTLLATSIETVEIKAKWSRKLPEIERLRVYYKTVESNSKCKITKSFRKSYKLVY